MNGLPGDVGGVVAQQEGDDGCHLVRRRSAFHDTSFVRRIFQFFLSRGGVGRPVEVHLRHNPARRHGVDANPVVDELLRHGFREGHDAGFYGVVDPSAGSAEKSGLR